MNYSIHIPDSLHLNLKRITQSEGISANQFIASTAAKEMTSINALDFLKAEGTFATRKDFDYFLAAVPD